MWDLVVHRETLADFLLICVSPFSEAHAGSKANGRRRTRLSPQLWDFIARIVGVVAHLVRKIRLHTSIRQQRLHRCLGVAVSRRVMEGSVAALSKRAQD